MAPIKKLMAGKEFKLRILMKNNMEKSRAKLRTPRSNHYLEQQLGTSSLILESLKFFVNSG